MYTQNTDRLDNKRYKGLDVFSFLHSFLTVEDTYYMETMKLDHKNGIVRGSVRNN